LVDFNAEFSSPSAVTKVLGRKVIADETEEISDSKVRIASAPFSCLFRSVA